jgi:hypothetical protein
MFTGKFIIFRFPSNKLEKRSFSITPKPSTNESPNKITYKLSAGYFFVLPYPLRHKNYKDYPFQGIHLVGKPDLVYAKLPQSLLVIRRIVKIIVRKQNETSEARDITGFNKNKNRQALNQKV